MATFTEPSRANLPGMFLFGCAGEAPAAAVVATDTASTNAD